MDARSGLTGAIVALLGAGALAGCGSSSTPTVPSSHLTDAAFRTTHGPGFKMALDMNVSAGGQSVAITGNGALGSGQEHGTFTLKVADQSIEEIIASPYIYVKVPSATSDKPWVKAKSSVFTQGASASSAGSDPTKTLDYLKAAGKVENVGNETIRGTDTTHYRATVDLDRYVANAPAAQRAVVKRSAEQLKRATGSSTLPIEAFIDAQGRVRREVLNFDLCTAQGKASLSMTIDIYDFGPQNVPAPPPDDQVSDITDQLQSQLNAQLKQLKC